MADLAVWGSGIAATAYLLFLIYAFVAWRGGRTGAALLLALSGSLVWALAGVWQFSQESPLALLTLVFAEVVKGAGWLVFMAVLLAPLLGAQGAKPIKLVLAFVTLQVLALVVLVLQPDLIRDSARAVVAVLLAGTVAGLVMVEQLYRLVPPQSRWGLKPLCLGLAAVYVFDLYFLADGFLFGRLDTDVWAIRGFVATLVLPLLALSASRSPTWTMRMLVSREVFFHSTALALAGAYLLLISAAGYYVRYFGGDWGRALQVGLMAAGLLLLGVFVFSGSQRARLRVWLSKHLFPYRYDYRAEWLRFTQSLSSAGDSMDLGQSVIKALSDLVESSGGVLWLKGSGETLRPAARLNHPEVDVEEPSDSAFCAFLNEREWIVVLEEDRNGMGAPLPDWLFAMPDAWLVVPLKSGDNLVGFVVLNTPRARLDVNWEVLDLLKTAGRQAASFLARMQAAEALMESRKFESFNRMSAFVVHDLKNLVAQLSLMLRNAERHKHNPEFQADMLETVQHVEARMRALMQQLQEKRSVEARRRLDLVALVSAIRNAKRHQRPEIKFIDQSNGGLEVEAHGERLQRIIGHVVQNALDAVRDDGNVSAILDRTDGSWARIRVIDDGCGMTPEFVRDSLFKPFQTSKASGMGIGMFETLQYVRELGGDIRVESEPGKGSSFTILLPLSVKGDELMSTSSQP